MTLGKTSGGLMVEHRVPPCLISMNVDLSVDALFGHCWCCHGTGTVDDALILFFSFFSDILYVLFTLNMRRIMR